MILNGQVNLHVAVSKVDTEIMNVEGDADAQSVAAGNVLDVTTMNDTYVVNNQYATSVNISSTMNTSVQNVQGSVGIQSQALCNGANISTDPITTSVTSYQECEAKDPSSTVNAFVQNVKGDTSIASSALGNTFSADSNAPNMPVDTTQINRSSVYSTVNANVYNVLGSVGVSSAAIGNNAQVIHYSTDE